MEEFMIDEFLRHILTVDLHFLRTTMKHLLFKSLMIAFANKNTHQKFSSELYGLLIRFMYFTSKRPA